MALFNGGAGNDSLNGGIENDSLFGFAGNDSLGGGDGMDSMAGGDGDDQLRGDAGNDTIRGNAGNDYITGGSGDDSIFGGGGYDTADYYFSDSFAGINANLTTGLVTGGGGNDTLSGIENINGTDFNDTITGNTLNNKLEGRGGNDSIVGDAGNDDLRGGDGNDTLLGGAGADTVRGGAGNDVLDGGAALDLYFGTDGNSISYSDSTGSVFINMTGVSGDGTVGSGIATDGLGGSDTLLNLQYFQLSANNDFILGSSAAIAEQFEGGLGDDVINGGTFETVYLDAYNAVTYQNSPGAVLVDLFSGMSIGASGNDTLINIHRVRGSSWADTLYGSDAAQYAEDFEGRLGNDIIDGRGGQDQVRYTYLNNDVGVYVNLATGVAIAGADDVDTLINIERVRGSQYNDTLIGGNPQFGADQFDGFERFRGEGGDDFIDGGAGFDEVMFANAGAGTYVVLGGTGAGYAYDGSGGIDTLWNIEQVYGSFFDDYLEGSDTGEFESFDGQIGNDTIDGKGGTDRVSYYGSRSGVNVNLTTGIASEYFMYGGETVGIDTLRNIEWARGSENFGDTLIGSAAANKLEGNGGDDTLDGAAGIDTMEGGNGSDLYYVRDVGDEVTETNRLRATGGEDTVLSYITTAMSSTGFLLGDYLENLQIATTAAANGSGNGLDNKITANLGDNVLDGGSGRDTVSFELATGGVTASIASTATGQQTTGGSGNDTLLNFENITGGSGNDSLTGSAGDNELRGGAGADTMVGGLGNDKYEVDNAGDVIVETSALATEIDEVYSTVSFSLAGLSNVENLYLMGPSGINGTGNALDNFLEGNDFANNLAGGDGNDTLNGDFGNDTLVGGNGNDVYVVNSAGDVVTELPGQGTDLVRTSVSFSLADTDGAGSNGGNVENLELLGTAAINGTGNALNNTIYAGAGDNVISGDNGTDTVSYARSQIGVAVSLASQGVAQATNGSGTDTLNSIEWLEGSPLNDNLTGDAGANKLVGLAGDDTITITAGGADTVVGGEGGDQIEAGGVGSAQIDGGVWTDYWWGSDMNLVSYAGSAVAVTIDLSGISGGSGTSGLGLVGTGTVNKGANGTDTLVNINQFIGSELNDSITGSTARQFEFFRGGQGNDTINGGAFNDFVWYDDDNRVGYQDATAAVNVNLSTGLASGGAGNDVLLNINSVVGGVYSDVLTGSSFAVESFEGRGGDDTIDGGAGRDRVRYNNAPSAVYVDLLAGIAEDGYGGTDTLVNIERVNGSGYNDILIGGAVANGVGSTDGFESFRGLAGNDTINGGGGYDLAEYDNANEGIFARLGGIGNGTVYDGLGGVDTLISIEGVNGSIYADRMIGSDSAVFESFRGDAGNDTVDGKGGTDRADYTNSRAAVTVNLLTGSAADGFGSTDTLFSIEDVRGSSFSDTITGTTGNNKIFGEAGNDTLLGDAGFDSLDGGDGNDNLNGGINGDTLIGGLGNDLLGGGQGLDVLNGGDGNDTLIGGLGSDNLTGGSGADRFSFRQALAGNVDTITDFASGVDVIELSAAIFGALSGQVGATVGTSANITYNNVTGALAYDADGAGLGGSVTFAILGVGTHPASVGNDFAIVA